MNRERRMGGKLGDIRNSRVGRVRTYKLSRPSMAVSVGPSNIVPCNFELKALVVNDIHTYISYDNEYIVE